jgi:membrane associated rhomboid family serine protease
MIFSLRNILEMRVWTPVTAIFVRASLMHLVGNMIFLYVFGNTLESVENSRRMLGAFFLGGTLSFVLSLPQLKQTRRKKSVTEAALARYWINH